MELPVTDKFCCSYNMRGGALAMGMLNSVMTVFLSLILIDIAPLVKGALQGEDEATLTVVHAIVVIQAVLLVIKILLDLACIYATYKENTNLLKKYFIFWIVFMVIYIIGFLKTLFHMNAVLIIIQVGYLLINLYIVMVIRSYVVLYNRDGGQ